jgi:hypothetical protein
MDQSKYLFRLSEVDKQLRLELQIDIIFLSEDLDLDLMHQGSSYPFHSASSCHLGLLPLHQPASTLRLQPAEHFSSFLSHRRFDYLHTNLSANLYHLYLILHHPLLSLKINTLSSNYNHFRPLNPFIQTRQRSRTTLTVPTLYHIPQHAPGS